jgi:methylmalonic aciduria homocystinuria type C protein
MLTDRKESERGTTIGLAAQGTHLERAGQLLALLESRCMSEGFDLVAATTLEAYDRITPEGFRLSLPWPGNSLLVLVGNTRAAWPRFLEAADRPPLADHPHPFDTWTVERLGVALSPAFEHPHDLRFAFAGPPRHFSALHLAEATGLAYRGPAALAIHPLFGPWFALRAALTVALPWREAAPPTPICAPCSAPCKGALAAALAANRAGGHRDHWRPWLAVRDACPVGVEHRYSDPQIRWHYAHDRAALRARAAR